MYILTTTAFDKEHNNLNCTCNLGKFEEQDDAVSKLGDIWDFPDDMLNSCPKVEGVNYWETEIWEIDNNNEPTVLVESLNIYIKENVYNE